MFFGVMNLPFQSGSPIVYLVQLIPREYFLSDFFVLTVKFNGGDVFHDGVDIFFMVWLELLSSCG